MEALNAPAWARLAAQPSAWVHPSWWPVGAAALLQAPLASPVRRTAEHALAAALGLPPLTAADAQAPGASLCVVAADVLDALAAGLPAAAPAGAAPHATWAAALGADGVAADPVLQRWARRPCSVLGGNAAMQGTLAQAQAHARLATAGAGWPPALAARWRLRFAVPRVSALAAPCPAWPALATALLAALASGGALRWL